MSILGLILITLFSMAAVADTVPSASLSSCDPESVEFKAMLQHFPPAELNSWMLDEEGNCGACLDPAHPKIDKKTGYLIIDPASFRVFGRSVQNVGSAMVDQVKGIIDILETGAKVGFQSCEAAYVYVKSAGTENPFAEALRKQKAEFKKSTFEKFTQQEMVEELKSFCQTGERRALAKLDQDNAQFLYLQLQQCMGMGYRPAAKTVALFNQYYLDHRLSQNSKPLQLDLKQIAPISIEKLVEKYRSFSSFKPELTSAQQEFAVHGLDQVLAQMVGTSFKNGAIGKIQGAACLPSPFRSMIEGTIAGNLVNPFQALKVLRWANKTKILTLPELKKVAAASGEVLSKLEQELRVKSEVSPNSLAVKYSPKQIGLYSSQLAYSKLKPLAGRIPTQIENKLKSMKIKSKKSFSHGNVNSVYEVTLEDGTKGIWKPHSETTYSGYRTEVLSYEFDRRFDFDLVPATVERTIDGKKGSMQLFVEKAPDQWAQPMRTDFEEAKQYMFDFLTAQGDRKGDNWFLDTNGKINSIDNGISFNNLTTLHRQPWRDVRKIITQFLATEEGAQIIKKMKAADLKVLQKEMSEYVGEHQAKAATERIEFMIKHYDEKFGVK